MKNIAYLDQYEIKLTELLVAKCTEQKWLSGHLLASEDLSMKWQQVAPEYVVDAIPQITHYPAVSLAWAAYVGMAFACFWDKDWTKYNSMPDLYDFVRKPRGFDCMDEYIVEEILGLRLDSETSAKIENILRTCAHSALDMIRHENIEPQSSEAFHVYARSIKVLYHIGVSIELTRRKYTYQKVQMN